MKGNFFPLSKLKKKKKVTIEEEGKKREKNIKRENNTRKTLHKLKKHTHTKATKAIFSVLFPF